MSQNSTTSTSSRYFTPITVDNGNGESNTTAPSTSRLDKEVNAVKDLQTKQGLVNLAYERRSLPIKLKLPTTYLATNTCEATTVSNEPTVVG